MTRQALNQDFMEMIQALNGAGVEYLVVGAHAMAVHGVPRATGDFDIWVRPARWNGERLLEALREFGAPVADHGITADDLERPDIVYQIGLPPRRIDLMTGISGVEFDAAAERPYELGFETSFTDLDLGALFRAIEPEAPPTLEGVFEVRSEASGRGRNLADLGFGSLGSVWLTGRDGVFRGLAGQFGLARTGAGVLGFLTFSKQLKAVSRLLGELEALEFETFALELARETPRRFAISELKVVSPLALIDGSGGVEVEPADHGDRLAAAAGPLEAQAGNDAVGHLRSIAQLGAR